MVITTGSDDAWREWLNIVIIVVSPGLYKSVHSISVSEVEIWECRQCHLVVALRDSSPWGYFQWVLVSAKQAMSISN